MAQLPACPEASALPPKGPIFLQGAIAPLLARKTLAMLTGILGMLVFNLTDTYFISRLGTTQLAAMGFCFPVVMAISAMALGLATGSSAVISKAVGRNDSLQVQRLTTDSLLLAFLIVLFFVALSFSLHPILFFALGADKDLLPFIGDYLYIWYWSMPFLVVPMVGNSAIRAKGNMKKASFIMLAAMLVNLILDPLLIFGLGLFPRMEMQGAALATLISRALTFVLSLWVLYAQEEMITLNRPSQTKLWESFRSILRIALPTGATNLVLPLGIGMVTKLVATFGTAAVAAYGVAFKVEMLALYMLMALSAVIAPFFGQNWGAKRFARIEEGMRRAYQFSLLWGLILVGLFFLASHFLARLFSDDATVVSLIVQYLWIVPFGYGFQGILSLSASPLNVLEKPYLAALLSLVYVFVFFIPLSFIGAKLGAMQGIFSAALLSKVFSGLLALLVLKKIYAREKLKLQ